MKKNIGTWIIAGIAGVLLLLLLNTSPLSRLGLTAELPFAWQIASTGDYKDSHCKARNAEGVPFAFKRPNESQNCVFDANNLALLFDGIIGLGLGLGGAFASTKAWSGKNT